ncbi:MAG TPA: serine/threonine-protein kinase, partial [Gemmatales bacterium]|nr:serine/threonine-protein kinase [Gemmatales bacterium]
MPQPTTSPEFLDIVRRSGLIQPDRLEAFLNKYETVGEEPNRVAMALIQEGLLTNFQARQLLKGRYRGFAIGKYLVLEQLGEGGMGKVFLCEHMVMRRRVAIKVLARELANDPSTLLRFQQEARAVAALDHPNIVRAHDVDSEGDNHFIVMEYVDGTSLHDIVRKRGPLSPERASYFIKQAAIGLDQVMLAGMIHRDIKPGNLLLDRKGNVKLLDLGLARFAEEKRESVTQKFDEGSVLGTADYLSPEQAMDSHDVDIRTDIYSLGATFYFLLTGRPPFEGGTVTQKLLFHQMKEPERLAKLRPDLPAELIAVVEKMMAKDRNVRYQKPAEVVAALEPWTQGPPTTPGEDEMPRLSLAAQRAGTAEANPLPNLPPAVQPSISRNNLASSSQRRLSDSGARSTAEGTSTSSVVHLSGVHSGIGTLPGRPGAASGSMRRRPASTIRRRRSRRRWVLLSVGLIALIAGAWWFWPRPKAGGDQVFYISQSLQAPGRAFRSINEALRERDPQRNLRIIIRDQEINEHVRLQPVPNVKAPTLLIIETETAGGGALTGAAQRVRWRPRQGNTAPLLHVEGVPNVEIKDIEFDGQDLVKEVVVIEGECPRFEMTGCHVRAMRQTGIRLVQAQGSERYPISITTTRIYPSDAGDNEVTFVEMASMAGDVGKMCRHIVLGLTLQGKNRPAQGLVITGPVDDVFVRNSFFQDLDNAVWFRRAAVEAAVAGQPIRMRFERTTFDTLRNGFRFENLVSPIPPQITLATCGFMGVQRLAHSDGFVAEPAPATVSNLQWIWTPDVNEQHLARPGKRF